MLHLYRVSAFYSDLAFANFYIFIILATALGSTASGSSQQLPFREEPMPLALFLEPRTSAVPSTPSRQEAQPPSYQSPARGRIAIQQSVSEPVKPSIPLQVLRTLTD